MQENPQLPRFESCTILYRAIPYPEWVRRSDGVHKHQTFMLRSGEDGLSLFASIEACKNHFNEPIFGVRSIKVQALQDHNLDVFRDDANHSNIKFADGERLPQKKEQPAEALNMADDLMAMSRPIPYWENQDADEQFAAEIEAKVEAKRAAAGE